ncbi:MAG: hypothetical protein KatS3mg027_0011 [Bacteroidia bacterium]|nr:MAG: hypothetical protein KatS3mg027_0011 [Bacteroidia bacterium]
MAVLPVPVVPVGHQIGTSTRVIGTRHVVQKQNIPGSVPLREPTLYRLLPSAQRVQRLVQMIRLQIFQSQLHGQRAAGGLRSQSPVQRQLRAAPEDLARDHRQRHGTFPTEAGIEQARRVEFPHGSRNRGHMSVGQAPFDLEVVAVGYLTPLECPLDRLDHVRGGSPVRLARVRCFTFLAPLAAGFANQDADVMPTVHAPSYSGDMHFWTSSTRIAP